MSSPRDSKPIHISPPKIRIQSATPEPLKIPKLPSSHDLQSPSRSTPRRTPTSPIKSLPSEQSSKQTKRKRSLSPESLQNTKRLHTMSPGSSRSHSGSSKKQSSSPVSPKKSKSGGKDVDWTDVKDPEERRRIQNRLAQRKFREKTRENKEKAEREIRNQQHAGNSYCIPTGEDQGASIEPPWGGINLSHCISKGHDAESRRSSGRGTYTADDAYSAVYYNNYAYGQGMRQAESYGSSGGDEAYYDEGSYGFDGYDPNLPGYSSR